MDESNNSSEYTNEYKETDKGYDNVSMTVVFRHVRKLVILKYTKLPIFLYGYICFFIKQGLKKVGG